MSLRFDLQCFLLDYAEEIKKYGGVVLAINLPCRSEPFIYLEHTKNPERFLDEIL